MSKQYKSRSSGPDEGQKEPEEKTMEVLCVRGFNIEEGMANKIQPGTVLDVEAKQARKLIKAGICEFPDEDDGD